MCARIILFSGGVDSTVLAARSDKSDTLLSFDYGQQQSIELAYARKTATALGRSHHTAIIVMPLAVDDVIPGRNAILLAYAAAVGRELGASAIQIGCNAGDASHFPDCRPEFVHAMSAALKSAYGCTVEAPLLYTSRADVLSEWRATGFDAWSCYRPIYGAPCGSCRACLSR